MTDFWTFFKDLQEKDTIACGVKTHIFVMKISEYEKSILAPRDRGTGVVCKQQEGLRMKDEMSASYVISLQFKSM